MLIRKILIPLSGKTDPADPESLDIPALRTGFTVARQVGAHAEVLCVTAEPSRPDERWASWIPGYGVREISSYMEKEGKLRRRRTKEAYERALADLQPAPVASPLPTPGFSVNFVRRVGDVRQTVGEHGRSSDLIVLASSRTRWDMPFRPILEASLRRTGRPVLVTPIKPYPTFASRIALAWNESVESARAVVASLGLLRAAQSVHVICCEEGESVSPRPEKLIEHLAWHDISTGSVTLKRPPRQAGPAIIEEALTAGCDLLVLGTYFHTRAHSLLFGSMTEEVLSNPKMPTLLVP
jgi:nucleotide-binding universal stress UspA family protein